MGAALSNMVSYATAKNSSKHPEEFGTGIPDGIWAPEVANNASVGGAVIPMIALGIPGDGTTAMLLGGLTIHGIQPGPLMQQNNPVFTYMIFLSALLAAILCLLVEIFGIRWFPKLLDAPYHFLYPAILALCLLGVYIETFNIANIIMACFFIAVGLYMMYAGIPTTPFILSFVLGSQMENYFRKAISYGKGDWTLFFTRPVSCILLIVAVGSVFVPLIKASGQEEGCCRTISPEISSTDRTERGLSPGNAPQGVGRQPPFPVLRKENTNENADPKCETVRRYRPGSPADGCAVR